MEISLRIGVVCDRDVFDWIEYACENGGFYQCEKI